MNKNLLVYTLISFTVSMPFFMLLIPLLKKRKITQFIRKEGPENHKIKKGIPTGSGIVFLIVPALFLPFFHSKIFIFLYLSLLLNGLIGFIDDFKSIRKKESLGLTARGKIILQLLIA